LNYLLGKISLNVESETKLIEKYQEEMKAHFDTFLKESLTKVTKKIEANPDIEEERKESTQQKASPTRQEEPK